MKRILTALSASTVLFGAMLVPSAGASVSPGHGPGTTATAPQVGHNTYSPVRATPLGASMSPIKVVSLSASFSPPSAALALGEPLIILVSHSVRAHLKIASGGALVYTGHDGSVYLFYARKPGISVVSAQVQPRCQAKACPQWRTAPDLVVTTY